MNTPVKHFTSTMTGAPVVGNNWGDLVALLDACLVNGFGLKAIDSLTSAGGIATASISTGHAYQPQQTVLVAGATQAPYNGEVRVLATTATTFTYALPGTDTPASPATTSASITAKVAPLGWEKPFAATHKGAYRSKNPQSPQNILLVDNALKTPGYTSTWAKWANVGIVEDMGDIDTLVGAQAPFDPALPTKNWQPVQASRWGWHKWYHARTNTTESAGDGGAGARSWVLVGDDRLFFLCLAAGPSTASAGFAGRICYCFGDLTSFRPGDNYATVLSAEDNYADGHYSYPGLFSGYGLNQSLDYSGKVLLRDHSQMGNPVRFGVTSLNISNSQQICGRGTMPFPNGADYSLWLLPTYVQQEGGHMRGMMPGMLWIPQNRPYGDLTVVDNVVGQPGKRFLLVRTYSTNEAEGAQIAFDITGPWR